MNVPRLSSPTADAGAHSVTLLDYMEAISSPVNPISIPEDGPCPASSKPKWVDVVAPASIASSRMHLSYFPPQIRESKVVVCPPQDVIDQGSDRWNDCVVGYFLDKRVPFPLVKNIVMRIWEKFGIYDVLANDQGFFFFQFSKPDAYHSLMGSGLCHIAGKLMILKPWKPQMELTKERLSSIPIWVQFSNIPLEFWTEQGLSYIASALGKPLYADDLTEKGQRLSFAKICVEITVDSPLLDVIEVEYANGGSSLVKVKYPWTPLRCSECCVFGHTEARHTMPPAKARGPGTTVLPSALPPLGQEASLPSEEAIEQAMVRPSLPADEAIEQALVRPVGPVLNASNTLGHIPSSQKASGSPSFDVLLSPRVNTIVMPNGIASDLVVNNRGLVIHEGVGCSVDKGSPTTQGLGKYRCKNRCSNVFSILESTLPKNGQASDVLDPAELQKDSDLVIDSPQAPKKKGRGKGGGGGPPKKL
ncbi:hypothetical protein RHSIM_RhsimUnG0127600 [Rhododendron simsii]|uniref:DUF4283 domain-containing protein n=1 Tax=Rhododendron simsii TaxID=118357 RepID=A0A834FV31_RHOSS|nr:hypothetical protein RHSIM_RhsimUnG0127600 [Rhododendron simsii]